MSKALSVSRVGSPFGGLPSFKFDLSLCTFTPNMAKRAGSVFAGAPIVQGAWDGSGTPDVLTVPRGDLVHGYFYRNVDISQGTIAFAITPEWDGNDGLHHQIFWTGTNQRLDLSKNEFNYLNLTLTNNTQVQVLVTGWTAGTTYYVSVRWNFDNTLDGTNYACISVNDSHTFGIPVFYGAKFTPGSDLYIGSRGAEGANAIIEGATIYRLPLSDGTYGVDVGCGDFVAQHAAGADPLEIWSFDYCLCIPTDADTSTALATTGQAHSYPSGSTLLEQAYFTDGGYLGGEWALNGSVDCGSNAVLDNMPNGANGWTWEGWVRIDANAGTIRPIAYKGPGYNNHVWRVAIDASNRIRANVNCATTDADTTCILSLSGVQWHHIVASFKHPASGGDGKIYIAFDGAWRTSSQTAAVGAYDGDAADNLSFSSGVYSLISLMGWQAFHNISNRYTVGTDFIPPLAPVNDANTIEIWGFEDGSGNTVAATKNSPACDGTATNYEWTAVWDQENSPLVPCALEFDGAATILAGTSGANIDNLPSGGAGMTAEGWFRHDSAGESNNGTFWDKTSWYMRFSAAGTVRVFFDYDNTDIDSTFSWSPDKELHYWMLTYNEAGDRRARVYRDGLLVHVTAASVGNYVADAAQTLYIGNNAAGSATMDGLAFWQGMSNVVRESDTFIPPGLMTPRTNDANMHLRYAMTDGAGTTVTDTSGNGYNGTITMGSGQWHNTVDLETLAPGAANFAGQGYLVASDAVDEGIVQKMTGLVAGSNYVMVPHASWNYCLRGQPEIVIYDNTNGAPITTFTGPKLIGTHTGANNAAALEDTANKFVAPDLVTAGAVVYNITDGSSGTITAFAWDGTKTTFTATLAGGTDNDWDTNDEYMIVFDKVRFPWVEPFTFELPTIARDGVGADCTEILVKGINVNDEGTLNWHRLDLQANEVDAPSMEVGAGNPWIPSGWTNGLGVEALQAGEGIQENAIVHSGSSAFKILYGPGAYVGRYISSNDPGLSAGDFFIFGGYAWKVTGNVSIRSKYGSANRQKDVYSASSVGVAAPGSYWAHLWRIVRSSGATSEDVRLYSAGSSIQSYFDDIYLIPADAVTFSAVTPASEANSAEDGGIRVDGRDTLTQPIENATATYCDLRGPTMTPRHDLSDVGIGQNYEYVFYLREDANNYIYVRRETNLVRLAYNANGAGEVSNTWAGPWNEGDGQVPRVKCGGGGAKLYMDGTEVINIAGAVAFATDFTQPCYWGSSYDGSGAFDGTLA